mgnify:CR=1 FL=1
MFNKISGAGAPLLQSQVRAWDGERNLKTTLL